jgi:hypothetical protein
MPPKPPVRKLIDCHVTKSAPRHRISRISDLTVGKGGLAAAATIDRTFSDTGCADEAAHKKSDAISAISAEAWRWRLLDLLARIKPCKSLPGFKHDPSQ